MQFSRKLVLHFLIQVLAFMASWFWWSPVSQSVEFAGLSALCALILASYWRLPLLLRFCHAALMPLILLAISLNLPAWYYMLGFVVLFAVSRNAAFERVPFYLSSSAAAEAVSCLLPEQARMLDLGCGSGKLIFAVARKRPDTTLFGIENAIIPWLLAKMRWFASGRPRNVVIRYGNMWEIDWGQFAVIYAFLSPAPMGKVWQCFQSRASAGSMLVSNSFAIDGIEPDNIVQLDGHLQKSLLIWQKK